MKEPTGAVLTKEGMSGREFFIVLDGWIEVYHDGRIIADYGPGYVFGEIALIDDRPRTATVVAKTQVTVDVIAQREFWALLDQVPKLSKKLLQVVARRVRRPRAEGQRLRLLGVSVRGVRPAPPGARSGHGSVGTLPCPRVSSPRPPFRALARYGFAR